MISSIPWVKRIVNHIRKEEQEAKNIESAIDFNSKTPTSYTAVFSTN